MIKQMWPALATLGVVAVMAGCSASAAGTVEPVVGGGGGGGTAVTASPIPSPFSSPQGTGDPTTGDKGTGSEGGTDIPTVPQVSS